MLQAPQGSSFPNKTRAGGRSDGAALMPPKVFCYGPYEQQTTDAREPNGEMSQRANTQF